MDYHSSVWKEIREESSAFAGLQVVETGMSSLSHLIAAEDVCTGPEGVLKAAEDVFIGPEGALKTTVLLNPAMYCRPVLSMFS